MSFQAANTKGYSGAVLMRPDFDDGLEPIPGTPLERSREALQSYNIAKLELDLRRQPPLQIVISNTASGKFLVERPRLEEKPSKDKRCRPYSLSKRTLLLLATIIAIIMIGAVIAGSLGGNLGRRSARPSSGTTTLHNATLTIMNTATITPLLQSIASSATDISNSSSIHTSTFQNTGSHIITLGSTIATPTGSQTNTLGPTESYSAIATPTGSQTIALGPTESYSTIATPTFACSRDRPQEQWPHSYYQ